MSSMVAGGLLGLALGVRHALEPDHVAAVGTFVPGNASPRRAAEIGALWGAGHAASLCVLGAAVLALRVDVAPWLDAALELAVGMMLVVLGLRTLRAAHAPAAVDEVHAHAHAHGHEHDHRHRVLWMPFAVGLAHGAAGTGAAVLLATGSMRGTWTGLSFLMVFGAGSILGMAALAGLVGVPLQRAENAARYRAPALAAAGLFSAAVGLWWIARTATGLA